jgi:hypothetical protein
MPSFVPPLSLSLARSLAPQPPPHPTPGVNRHFAEEMGNIGEGEARHLLLRNQLRQGSPYRSLIYFSDIMRIPRQSVREGKPK